MHVVSQSNNVYEVQQDNPHVLVFCILATDQQRPASWNSGCFFTLFGLVNAFIGQHLGKWGDRTDRRCQRRWRRRALRIGAGDGSSDDRGEAWLMAFEFECSLLIPVESMAFAICAYISGKHSVETTAGVLVQDHMTKTASNVDLSILEALPWLLLIYMLV